MQLRFIGRDGSMGLRHGQIYTVDISSDDYHILVRWYDRGGRFVTCPYNSVKAFADNWC